MTTRGWTCHTRAQPSVTCSTEGRDISMSHELPCVICFVVWPTRFPTKWQRFWEFYPQDGGVENLPTRRRQCCVFEISTHKMAAWEFCLQNDGVSETFSHKMAAREICLQDGGNAAFFSVLPTRWRRGNFAYKMAACLIVFPTRWRRGKFAYKMAAMPRFWVFYLQDGGVSEIFTHKMAAREICL